MKTEIKAALALILFTVAADAMAQGSPRRVTYMLVGGGIGGVLGFLAGLWWCRRCHEKNKGDRGDKGDQPMDR
jgi:hypothetical protein